MLLDICCLAKRSAVGVTGIVNAKCLLQKASFGSQEIVLALGKSPELLLFWNIDTHSVFIGQQICSVWEGGQMLFPKKMNCRIGGMFVVPHLKVTVLLQMFLDVVLTEKTWCVRDVDRLEKSLS